MRSHDMRSAGQDHVEYTRNISRGLIEKSMEMRCKSYLAQVKANLLTETIFEVDKSRKMIRKANANLAKRVKQRTKALSDSNAALEREVVEHRRTEDYMRKLSEAIEHAGEGILLMDKHGEVEYANKSFCDMMGYDIDDVVGNALDIVLQRKEGDNYESMWSSVLEGQVWHDAILSLKKDGQEIPLMMSIAPIYNHDDELASFVLSQQDMSRQKELEEQFQQAQKMEAMGTLVGGIAHDFNNMLAAMTGNIYLLKMETPAFSLEARKHLENIETVAFRASEMIKQLLLFARKGLIHKTTLSLTALIKESLHIQRVSVPANIKLNVSCCSDLLNVYADATQLQQVLINLINNARDAVEDVSSPVIEITLEPFVADEVFLEKHKGLENKQYAHLSIHDNGCGIEAEQLEKVFDPFYTTKEVGKGTGLGLAMVFGTISSFHGLVDVESSVGKGTTFHLYIPLETASATEYSNDALSHIKQGDGEIILLVDDNQQVLNSNKKVLEKMGYRVLTASDGVEAVEIYSRQRSMIDLVLLDLVMPRMSGEDAAHKMMEMCPDVKILFATAYDSNGKLAGDMALNHVLLEKPFTIPLLSTTLRECLGK